MWYEKFDFDKNPFDADPIQSGAKMVGNERIKDEIIYRVHAGSIVFVEGKSGTGKTALLKHVIDNFKGRGKVIFLDCNNLEREANIEKVLIKKNNFLSRLMKDYPRGMILLMDGVDGISEKNTERIKYFFDQNYLKSVILTGESLKNSKISPSLKDRIGNHVIKLNEISEAQAIELVSERLIGKEVIPTDIIKRVYKESDKNAKKILEMCERLCVLAIEKGDNLVTDAHFEELFGDKKFATKTTPKKEIVQKKPVVKKEEKPLEKISPKEIKKEEKKKEEPKKVEKKEEKKKEAKKVEVEYTSKISFGGKKTEEWKENEEELEDELEKEIEAEKAAEKYY